MPETVPALSAEDEAKAKEKIQDMEKEFEEHRGFLAEFQSEDVLIYPAAQLLVFAGVYQTLCNTQIIMLRTVDFPYHGIVEGD